MTELWCFADGDVDAPSRERDSCRLGHLDI